MRTFIRIIISVIVLFSSCKHKNKNNYFCDAENLTKDKSKFLTSGIEFGGGECISSLESYEGKYSCLLDENHKYGMEKKIENLIPGEIITVSVYRKNKTSNGYLVVSSPDNKFYQNERFSYSGKDRKGWEKITFDIQIPKNLNKKKLPYLKVYVAHPEGSQKIFFDNLKIERDQRDLSEGNYNNTETEKSNKLNIQLSDFDFERLFQMRDSAIYHGIISKDLKKSINGFLLYNNKTLPIEIRLKGDWIDHIVGKKWSFRIKIKQGQAFRGLKEFSVQSPETRDFLNEWIIHRICEKENILTTRYNFCSVNLNGFDLGVYALEEHFTKQLLESKERREGPILKFNEEGFWECNLFEKNNNEYPEKPLFEASTIMPFKQKKTIKSQKLKQQFLLAQNKMLKYKFGLENPNKFLDIKSFAKAYAIMSVCNVDHSFVWHNQRFYFNPVTSRLEIIVFDCLAGPGELTYRSPLIRGNQQKNEELLQPLEYCVMSIFNDSIFQQTYLKYLKKYSEPEFLRTIISETEKERIKLEIFLQEDYEGYKFNRNLFIESADKIKGQIPEYEQKIKAGEIQYKLKENQKCFPNIPFKHISLNTHIQESKVEQSKLSVINYHCSDINIIGYGPIINPDSIIYFTTPKKIKKYKKESEAKKIITKLKPKKLFYQTSGSDSIYSCEIIMWPRPFLEEKNTEIDNSILDKNSKAYRIKGDKITFLKGNHIVDKNIIIPKNMEVEFEAGTELIFNKNSYLLSYSKVNMIGDKNNPITIKSTDGTGSGFTILQATQTSKLEYVNFEGLNTFDNNKWTLTGAVTFYESDVEINHCSFKNNHCEDALNIIRSKFLFNNSTIMNTPFDGFDADFCTGKINNCEFSNTKNDCMDFSGSNIEVLKSKIRNVGDKAISCGEKSEIMIKEVEIKNANTAIASKDMSETTVNEIIIKNCKTAFASFQKKAEYGPARIHIKNYKTISIKELTSIDEKSKVIFKK